MVYKLELLTYSTDTQIWSVCQTNAKTASQREKSFFLAVSAAEWIAMKSSAPVWLRMKPLRFCFTFRILMPPSEALLCDGPRGSLRKWNTWSLSFRRLLRICRNGFLNLSRFSLRSLSRLSVLVDVRLSSLDLRFANVES